MQGLLKREFSHKQLLPSKETQNPYSLDAYQDCDNMASSFSKVKLFVSPYNDATGLQFFSSQV